MPVKTKEVVKQSKEKPIPHIEQDVLPIYSEKSRFTYFPDSVPNPNILFYTGNTGMHIDTVQFYKMLVRKDAQFRTVISARKLAVLSTDWYIEPSDDSDSSKDFANFISTMFIDRIPSLRKNLNQMMDSIVTGYSIHEIITTLDENGNEVIQDLIYRNPDRFEFGTDSELYLIDETFTNKERRKKLDSKHFIIHTNEATNENPYGESVLGEASFWLYYLKNGTLKDWAQFNERYGQGILKGEYDKGNIKAMEQTFNALKLLRSNGYAVFEKGSNVEILEAARNSGDYKTFVNEIDRAIAKMVLGQELTTSAGEGYGSYSLGKVHQETFHNIILFDRKNLEETMNNLIKNILNRSFKGLNKYPKFKFVKNLTNKDEVK